MLRCPRSPIAGMRICRGSCPRPKCTISSARARPYLFSDEELGRLLQAPHQLRLFDAFRPLTLVTLMGLLASAGLRIGEALRLTLDDAKLEADPPHLLILDTKFGKSRVVVLHPSTADHLRTYVAARTAALRGRAAAAFFTTLLGRRLNYTSTAVTFRRLLHRAGIQAAPGPPQWTPMIIICLRRLVVLRG